MAIQRDKIVASAEKLVTKGKVEAAIKEYDRLLDDNPNDVNTLNRIGDLWVRINRTDEAVKVFTRIADHYAKDGFFLKAIAIFKKINKLDPSRLEIYARLADLYAKQGLAMEAKGQYQVLADYYLKHGDPDNALKTYQKIAELDPNSINVHVKLADLYSQNGRTADALKEYDRVGRMLLKRGMTDEAVQVFRKALKIDPKNVDLAESLANTLIEAKDFANARQLLDGALEGNPDDPRLIALLAKVHIGKGDLPAAERMLTEAVARNPGEASVTELLADLYLRRGKADSALNVLEPLVDAAAERGDRAAVELLQRVTRVSAAHIPALEKLVFVYERLNEETNILSSMNSLAEAHISSGNLDSAAEVLERLIKREPENAQHREKLSFVRGKGAAPAATPPPPPPAPEPATEDFEIGGDEDFALSIDVEEPADSGFASPPPMPPPPALPASPPIEPGEHEPEDLDFITEQLTEAEVFAKYGLTEKAIEHLQTVLDRSPGNLAAYEKLLRIHMDEGNASAVSEVSPRYLALLQERGENDTADAMRNELVNRGFSVSETGAAAPAPVADASEEEVEEIETPVLEEVEEVEEVEDLALTEETPELEFEVETSAAEVEQEAPGVEIDLSAIGDEGEPGGAIETEEAEPEIELEAEAEPQLEVETEGEIELETETPEVEIESDVPPAEAPATAEEPELTFDELPELTLEPEEQEQEEAAASSIEAEAPPEPRVEEIEIPEQAPPTAPAGPAMEELGEIDFYIEQDLLEEAADRIAALEERFPDAPEIRPRQEELERRRAAAAAAPPAEPIHAETDLLSEIREEVEEEISAEARSSDDSNLFDEEEDFFDLAAELEQELSDENEPISISEEEQSLEEIFKEFKRGVEQQLDAEDYDTHYNLGIAYKEMGLIDEAIGEFQLASKDPKRAIECCSMLGLCFLEKGMPQLAIKWYQKGLEMPEIRDEEHLGLLYDLGSAYLEVGDTANAQKAFLEVYGINSNYRDIVSRMKQLEDVAQ